jgi:hypothetical protein
MDPTRRAALISAGTGVAFQLAAFLTNALTQSLESPRLAQACALTIVLGALAVVQGCAQLARAKGLPWWLGALGILSAVGVAVVWMLPDKAAPTRSG